MIFVRFVIDHARRQDAGPYVCKAINAAGSRMATAFLTVESPPKFVDGLDPDQFDDLGGNSLLDCPVVADPSPTITWTKDGQVRYNYFGALIQLLLYAIQVS